MYKKYYSHYINANRHIQNYAGPAHSFLPDITRDATLEYWDDSAKFIGDKWKNLLQFKIPKTQKLIAEILNLSQFERIDFAPKTCDFYTRLLNSFDSNDTISILTTDSESYSFDNQIPCSHEDNRLNIDKISTQPFDDFEEKIIEKINKNHYQIIFFSHVFFNSGMIVKNLKKIIECVKDENTIIIIEGTHGFMTIPIDLAEIEKRVLYVVQANNGCSFMSNSQCSSEESFLQKMDSSSLYQLEAVLDLFKKDGLTASKIHGHIKKLQNNFRDHLLKIDHPFLTEKNILSVDYNYHGNFLTFAMPSPEHAKNLYNELKENNIWTDYHGSRLRFGFGIYQNDCIDLRALVKPF